MKRLSLRCIVTSFLVSALAHGAGSAEGYFRQILMHLQSDYIQPERLKDPRPMLRQALRALENSADEIMIEESTDPLGTTYDILLGRHRERVVEQQVTTPTELGRALERVMRFVEKTYNGETDVDDLRYAMANGMTSALDPHTNIFTPKQYKDFFTHIEGEICGIGAYIGVRDGKLLIISPLPNSPAKRTGILPGDEISKIEDESTVSMSTQEAVSRIRGERGSKVTLWIRRKGNAGLLKKSITRDTIQIKSVESMLLENDIAYLKVVNFAQNTGASFTEHLNGLTEKAGGRLRGVVLDLRDNPGGLLDQAAALADAFLKKGHIVLTGFQGKVFKGTFGVGGYKPMEAADDGAEPVCPIVVLVNQSSASGSEILAGALRYNNRALLLGLPTFGKGSVQQPRLLGDKSCLKLTVYEYLLPGGVSIQNVGVTPDIALDPAIVEKNEISVFAEDRAMRERLHRRAITSHFAKKESPFLRILHYLDLPDDPVDADAVARSFVVGEFDLDSPESSAVHLACRLILLMPPGEHFDRMRFLTRYWKEIHTIKEEKFTEVVEKLKTVGIDWREGAEPAEPTVDLDVTYEIRTTTEENDTKKAPDSDDELDLTPKREVLLKATLKNVGNEPLYRVYALTETDHLTSMYAERELLFGRVKPGQEVTRTTSVKISYFTIPREDTFSIAIRTHGRQTPLLRKMVRIKIPTAGTPRLAATASLLTKDGTETGTLTLGKEYRLRLAVENVGSTRVYQALTRLKNETEPSQAIFLVRGREVLKELDPGEERTVEFSFSVNGRPDEEGYRFRLDAYETSSNHGFTREFTLPARGRTPFATTRFEPPQITADAARLVTEKKTVRVEAEVQDDEAVRHFMILTVSRDQTHIDSLPDKVFFRSVSGPGPHSFAMDVPLEVGTNLVSVVATDNRRLKTIRSFLVKRAEAASGTSLGGRGPFGARP